MELSEEPLNNRNININTINQINDIELPVNNNVDDINEKQGEVNDLTKSINPLSFFNGKIKKLLHFQEIFLQ